MNRRTKQAETLIGVLESLDPKLKAPGVVEVNGEMTYIAESEGVDHA